MKAAVLSLEGRKISEIDLPQQFSAQVDRELIKRAVLAIQSAKVQTKSNYLMAGRDNTSIYVGARGKPATMRGINVEKARKPRLKNRRFLISGQVAGIPGVVGGPKAHPPKTEKVWEEKINRKEKRLATNSAIAATADAELVKARGHIVPQGVSFPIVVESKLEGLAKTKDVVSALGKIGVFADVERVKAKNRVRAGKGKRRGRKHKKGRSVLIVAAETGKIYSGARNLAGVDVVSAQNVNACVLAPGALPGRLTLWTEGAIKELGKAKEAAWVRPSAAKENAASGEEKDAMNGKEKETAKAKGSANEVSKVNGVQIGTKIEHLANMAEQALPSSSEVVRLTADRLAGGDALPRSFSDATGLRHGGVR